jgi:hypothetical protein
MERMLTEICEYLNNYFWRQKINGKFTISDGTFTSSFLKEGQYFRILGSLFNDGVYKYPATDLTDETFEGQLWSMAVPPTVVALANEIEQWQQKYGGIDSEAMSPFISESFGNYSYSKSASTTATAPNSWQSAYANRLNKWRKLRNI